MKPQFLALVITSILLGCMTLYFVQFADSGCSSSGRATEESRTQTASTFLSIAQSAASFGYALIPVDPCVDKDVPLPTVEERKVEDRFRLFLEEYSRKHKAWREAFLQGNNSIKTLTWTCTSECGGIGDRIQGIAFSLALSILSDRLLFVQWKSPFQEELQNHLFVPKPGSIDWDVDAKLAERLDSLSAESIFMEAYGFFQTREDSLKELKEQVLDPTSTHAVLRTNLDLYSEFMRLVSLAELKQMVNGMEDKIESLTAHNNSQYNESIASVLVRYLFRYSPALVRKASETMKELSIAEDQPYTAVHIRTGDFGSLNEEHGAANMESTWKVVLDCAVNRSREILGPKAPIVLFTDSTQVKNWTLMNYGYQVKRYPGQPKHMDRMVMTADEEIEMGAELVAISRASVLIRTLNSGFSEASMRMCPFNRKQVFTKEMCQELFRRVSQH